MCFGQEGQSRQRKDLDLDRDFDPELAPIEGSMCLVHVTDAVLRQQLDSLVAERECRLCGRRTGKNVRPFAVRIDVVAERMFAVVLESWMDADQYSGTGFTEDSHLVLYESVGSTVDDTFEEELHELIAQAMSVGEWARRGGDDLHYLDADEWEYTWKTFAETVKTRSRFVLLSTPSEQVGRSVPPEQLATFLGMLLHYMDAEAGIVTTLPVGAEFFRGRMTDDVFTLLRAARAAPAAELGSAPSAKAGVSRMSGRGISMFYGADSSSLALSEIASHSVHNRAVIGKFVALRPLRILDFTRTPTYPSPFDNTADERRHALGFIRDFVRAITSSVVLDGREHLEYLPTQIITEYLRWAPDERIDGIAYPPGSDDEDDEVGGTSSAKNYALFFDSEDITDLPRAIEPMAKWGLGSEPSLGIEPISIEGHRVTRSVSSTRINPLWW